MPLNKPWQQYDAASPPRIPGTPGVFELGDTDGQVAYIGFAGGKSRYGLRSEIAARIAAIPGAAFRYEVNLMDLTRFVELLEKHYDLHGSLPASNTAPGEYVPGIVRRRVRAAPGGQ
jgi:hypothetical protein